MSKVRKTTRFKNIDALVKGNGDVTIGRIGPVRCAPRPRYAKISVSLSSTSGKAWSLCVAGALARMTSR